MLVKAGIPHEVLNAKQHEREAKIIAQAGRKGAVTVSTNMAGRGTDILLGGNPEAMTRDYCLKNKLAMPYAPAGAVISALPAPKRRRKRTRLPRRAARGSAPTASTADGAVSAGRQDLPGAARSMEAALRSICGAVQEPSTMKWWPWAACIFSAPSAMRRGALTISCADARAARAIPARRDFSFRSKTTCCVSSAARRVKALMYRLGMTEGVPIESKLISKRIENAQKAVEAQNFEARKHLLEYDDVMNKQRETIYRLRRSFLEGRDQKEFMLERAEAIANSNWSKHIARAISIPTSGT